MARVFDFGVLFCIGFVGWFLVGIETSITAADGASPITTTVEVSGMESLAGLGLLIVAGDEHLSPAYTSDVFDDVAPHQLCPWQANRRTQIMVPMPGEYRVRWGIQEELPPRRPKDVLLRLSEEESLKTQNITITADTTTRNVFTIDLPKAHAAGLRRTAADD